jgi:hypothetical protein
MGYTPDPFEAGLQMQEVVAALNRTAVATRQSKSDVSLIRRLPYSDRQIKLRSLISRWMASGPNLRKLLEADPKLMRLVSSGTTQFYPGTEGRGYLDWQPSPPKEGLENDEIEAAEAFARLITNPLWATLCGPCPQCEDYFLRKTDRKRVYCSQRCSSRHTAISATAEKRLQTSKEKILKAQHEIREWKKAKPKANWKVWIAARASRSRISLTVHWLSRAVNSGAISPP